MIEKEENAIILDYLPYGYPLEGKMVSLAQAIGKKYLTIVFVECCRFKAYAII